MIYLKTLGSLSLRRGGGDGPEVVGGSKGVAALAYLASTPEYAAPRGRLGKLLWPACDRSRARRRLRQALYYVRQQTGVELVEQERDPLTLATGRIDVDLWRFNQATEDQRFEEAVKLYEGPFLETFPASGGREFEEWREGQAARLRAAITAAYEQLIRENLEADDVDAAIEHARRWVELNPLDATSESILIRTLLRAGDWVGAYGAYERYRTLLREVLGEEPEQALRKRIEEARPSLG